MGQNLADIGALKVQDAPLSGQDDSLSGQDDSLSGQCDPINDLLNAIQTDPSADYATFAERLNVSDATVKRNTGYSADSRYLWQPQGLENE